MTLRSRLLRELAVNLNEPLKLECLIHKHSLRHMVHIVIYVLSLRLNIDTMLLTSIKLYRSNQASWAIAHHLRLCVIGPPGR